jgi:hypothetical protein
MDLQPLALGSDGQVLPDSGERTFPAPPPPFTRPADGARTIDAPDDPRRLVLPHVGPRGLLLGLALLLFAAHSLLLGDWLVDDAGISFSYARNLAAGYGLVSQPGVPPVEGYSNPLWTLLLAPFFLTGTFVTPWTVKLLSVALVAATFWLLTRGTPGSGAGGWLGASAPILLALNTSFVVWTTSGLENPLLVFLAALSATFALRAARGENGRLDLAAGLVASLLALTRPDAIVYAAAYPLVVALTRRSDGLRRLTRRVAAYGLGFVVLFGSYLTFRRLYFEDWVPNTYHAKVRSWLLALEPSRLWELLQSATGGLTALVIALLLITVARLRRQREEAQPLVLLVYLALAGGSYFVLPPDWMGEYRFATAFLLFLYWVLGDALCGLWEGLTRVGSPGRWFAPAAALLLLVQNTALYADRSTDFARHPTVPFARISEFARAYDRLAEGLGPGSHSLLAPDLGGTLFHTNLRVFDLAGLCDRTVARTLMDDRDAFHDYVFETARPTFIHIHASWAEWAALHEDPRFARDYVVLFEQWERPVGAQHIDENEPWSGDYVRRENTYPDLLEQLRNRFRAVGLDRPL